MREDDDIRGCIQNCVQTTLLLQRALRTSSSSSNSQTSSSSSTDVTANAFVLTAVNANARQVLAEANTMLLSLEPPTSSSGSSSGNRTTGGGGKRVVSMATYLELHGARRELTDALRRATDSEQSISDVRRLATRSRLTDFDDGNDGNVERGGGSGGESNEEMASLLRTRAMLSTENHKMSDVLSNIQEGSAALEALHRSLEGVQSTLSRTNRLVGALVRVKRLEDVVLRISWVVFVTTFCWVMGQRLFAIGGPTVLA